MTLTATFRPILDALLSLLTSRAEPWNEIDPRQREAIIRDARAQVDRLLHY